MESREELVAVTWIFNLGNYNLSYSGRGCDKQREFSCFMHRMENDEVEPKTSQMEIVHENDHTLHFRPIQCDVTICPDCTLLIPKVSSQE